MKVAHVTSTFPPYWAGTGNVAYHNARVLHERGHRVALFTAETSTGETIDTAFESRYLHAAFRVGNAPLTPALLRELAGFELIHLHYPYIFGAECVLAAARRYRIPLVLTYHNQLQETDPLKRVLFSAYNLVVEPLLLGSSALVLTVSEGHLASLHPRLLERGKVAELPNGVDLATFRPRSSSMARAAFGVAPEVPVALFVGALDQAHRFKNVDGLIRAFARSSVANSELWIVGDGDLRSRLERLSVDLGLAERVRFFGKHPPDALPPFYSAADVTVLPSTGVESFGVVLIESMACGTPVIASSLPGVRAVVDDQVDGLLVRAGSEDELAAALDALLLDRARSSRMGSEGLAKVALNYGWNAIGERLERLYEGVLESWTSRSN